MSIPIAKKILSGSPPISIMEQIVIYHIENNGTVCMPKDGLYFVIRPKEVNSRGHTVRHDCFYTNDDLEKIEYTMQGPLFHFHINDTYSIATYAQYLKIIE